MQMMYETIYKALVESGLQNKYVPQDYLNFFCLGNREALDGVDSSNAKDSTAANTPQVPPFPVKSCFHLICQLIKCCILGNSGTHKEESALSDIHSF